MATDVEIANQALLRVGAESITSGEWNTPSNERSRVVKNSWPFVRREVLRCHPWNSVTTRARLRSLDKDATLTAIKPDWDFDAVFPLPTDCLRVLEVDTDDQWRVEVGPQSTTFVAAVAAGGTYPAAVSGEVILVTTSPHNLVTGDRVFVNNAYHTALNFDVQLVEVVNSTTFTLPNVSVAGFTAGSLGGMAVFKVNYGPCIVTDGIGISNVRYIVDESDPSNFDSMLTEALVLRLAVEIVERVTDSTRKREALMVEYQEFLREVKHVEGQEQSPSEFEEDLWISSRY